MSVLDFPIPFDSSALLGWHTVGYAVLVLVVVYALVALFTRPGLKGVPGPRQLPLIGNLIDVTLNLSDPMAWLLRCTEKFGLTWTGRLPGMPSVLFVLEPRDVEYILQTNFPNYIKGPFITAAGRDLLGDGIFNTNGDSWRLQRKFASPLFRHGSLRDMIPMFAQHAREIVDEFAQAAARQQVLEVQSLFYRHTLDIICRLALGMPLATFGALGDRFARAFEQAQQIAEMRFWRPFWRVLPEPGMRAHIRTLNEFAYEVIARKRAQLGAGSSAPDILSAYLRGSDDDGRPFSDAYLRDVVMNLLIAGRDTTAQTLTWACYLLSQNPAAEARVVEEAVRVLGVDGEPTYDNAKLLVYTRAVVEETLRLYPPVPVDPKSAVTDDVLPSGHRVPAGTLVMWSAYCMGRSRRLWPDADQFRPERFLPGRIEYTHPFQHIPFQAGPRQCLGMHMALLETRIVLAMLLRRFHLELEPGHPVAVRKAVTLPAKYGMRMLPVPRIQP